MRSNIQKFNDRIWTSHKALFRGLKQSNIDGVEVYTLKTDGFEVTVPTIRELNRLRSGVSAWSNKVAQSYGIDSVPTGFVVDVGAQIGSLGFWLLTEGWQQLNRYLAIEPGPIEHECLRRNLGAYGALIERCAAGEAEAEGTLYLAESGGNTSLSEPPYFRSSMYTKISTLDAIVAKHFQPTQVIDLLKIDAEGLEPEVLLGAPNVLKRTRTVAIDAGFERGPCGESTMADVTAILYKSNFELASVGEAAWLRFSFRNAELV